MKLRLYVSCAHQMMSKSKIAIDHIVEIPNSLETIITSMDFLDLKHKKRVLEILTVALLVISKKLTVPNTTGTAKGKQNANVSSALLDCLLFNRDLTEELIKELEEGEDIAFKV